jgi:TonB family protein
MRAFLLVATFQLVTSLVCAQAPASSPAPVKRKAKAGAIFAPRPDYPLEARQKHLTGHGVLILHIDRETGTVTSIDIEKSIGYKILDDAAVRAFSRWHFKPGKFTKVRVPIRYTINGAE